MVAGARNHRNRLDSPSRQMFILPASPHCDVNAYVWLTFFGPVHSARCAGAVPSPAEALLRGGRLPHDRPPWIEGDFFMGTPTSYTARSACSGFAAAWTGPSRNFSRLNPFRRASHFSNRSATCDRRGQPLSPADSAALCWAEGIRHRCRPGSGPRASLRGRLPRELPRR